MSKVVITGGAGFIGSHLAQRLLVEGHQVQVIDDLSTGSRDNIAHLLDNPQFSFTHGSVTDVALVKATLAGSVQVYHLAASVGVKHIMNNLVSSIHNNIRGTEIILQEASRIGAHVLLTSTSEVYGKISQRPSVETDDFQMGEPIKSRWSYACSKALDEYLAFAYYHEQNLPVTVVRLFNTVGERQSSAYGMVIPTFVQQALTGQPLFIHGDGSQSRCFIHVTDVVSAVTTLMKHPAAIGEVFNVGSTESVTIEQLADRIIALTGSNSIKQYIPYTVAYKTGFDDAYSRQPNIDKIGALIGFTPQYHLDDIIIRLAEFESRVPATAAA